MTVTTPGAPVAGPSETSIPIVEIFPIILLVLVLPVQTVAGVAYSWLDEPYPPAMARLLGGGAALSAYAWFYAYSERRRIPATMDMGFFFLYLWWAIVPYYLFRNQRWRAIWPIGAYLLYWLLNAGLIVAADLLLFE